VLALSAISMAAWVASIPVATAASRPGASFLILTLDAALSVIAVAGMELLVFTGVPFVFLDGHDLFRWRPRLWFVIWGSGVLWFSLVIVNPALSHPEGRPKASIAWLASLLAAAVVIAVSFWSFFAGRNRRRAKIAA
jgi:hypothetical protein